MSTLRPRSVTRSFLGVVVVLAVAVVSAGCGQASDPQASEAPLDFRASQLVDGEPVGQVLEGASLSGRDTVLWFWAPWCTTCRAEAPAVIEAADAYAADVTVLGVASRGEVGEMQDFVADTGTEGLTHLVDEEGTIWDRYGVVTQPAFAFVDDSGELVDVVVGSLGADGLDERLADLVGR